ncbi:MAG TPA: hypothetical protein PKK10_08430 [Woeseiaceae bacterium]|nr:hypothetical protein [Woeseiaceae bacterium]
MRNCRCFLESVRPTPQCYHRLSERPKVDKWLHVVDDGSTMISRAEKLDFVTQLDPREAAAQVAAAGQGERAWLDEFAENLDRYRASQSLARVLSTWNLSQSHAARLFGVSRQALNKWLERGVPAERTLAIADLAAATDLLVHYLKRDRIPAVVRRPAIALNNQSLFTLLEAGDSAAVLDACRQMFRFELAQS